MVDLSLIVPTRRKSKNLKRRLDSIVKYATKDVPLSLSPSLENIDWATHDGEVWSSRMKWWDKNGKPVIIPYHIGLKKEEVR